MLAVGAELLGDVSDERIVLPALRQLLKHVHALVREGAMTGLSSFYLEKKPPQDILERLRVMSKNDPSPDLKEYAQSLIAIFEVLP
jgi:vesicle coat complex subunit